MIERFQKNHFYRCSRKYPNEHGWALEMDEVLDDKPHKCTVTGQEPYHAAFENLSVHVYAWGADFARYWTEVFPESDLFT